MPFFYLARCADQSLYCGWCKDVQQRETAHNAGKGAKYTRSRLPIQIIHHEEFSTVNEAMKREAEVKTWSKKEKEELAFQK